MLKEKTNNVSKKEAVKIASNNVKAEKENPALTMLQNTEKAYKELDGLFGTIADSYNKAIAIAKSPENLVNDLSEKRFIHLRGKAIGTRSETAKKFDRLIAKLRKEAEKVDRVEKQKERAIAAEKAAIAKLAKLRETSAKIEASIKAAETKIS